MVFYIERVSTKASITIIRASLMYPAALELIFLEHSFNLFLKQVHVLWRNLFCMLYPVRSDRRRYRKQTVHINLELDQD